MMTIKQMIDEKNRSGLTYEQISKLSGVPLGTVQKVLGGITASPRYDTLLALEKVLTPEQGNDNLVRDESAIYGGNFAISNPFEKFIPGKKQGEYTIDDMEKLPEDQYFELIDGVLYVLNSPTTIHQIIGFGIAYQVKNYISTNKGKCIPLTAPCGVQLNKDDKNLLLPDFMIICDRDKVIKQGIYGAPDFIVEVLSPSTRRKDMNIKAHKYEAAGVREYWMVDPDKQKIIVYTYEGEEDVSIYSFQDSVPISIYEGKCSIDFKSILADIEFLL